MPKPQFKLPSILGLDPADAASTTDVAEAGTLGETNDIPTGPAAFTGVTREDVYRDAEERASDPSLINQGGSSLCGPAVAMYSLARYRNGLYERFVKQLFETGDATIGDLRVRPGEDCRRHNPGSHVGAADWVALAGLRDSENSVFDYDEWSDQAAGITLPMTLASWLTRMGFSGVRNETNLFFHKGKSNFLDAVEQCQKGRNVCMLVSIDGIETPQPGRGLFEKIQGALPNHWVVLTSVGPTLDNSVSFEVFTWGDECYKVPSSGGGTTLTMKAWLKNYYGYVSCDV